ncbi:hypothetical protein [Siccirubricoccus phaeus]|uniref:hypothetical protein n=1 Tax=Siccirubricoccus phaeus TaxID=2595053 RepID=UPI0011F37DB8|nr:hypothetical protein [Siccirubricoccus phaeus]
MKFREGGAEQRQADFQALGPTNIRTNSDGVTVGNLPDGTRIILRTSRDNGMTLEHRSDSRGIIFKLRY